MDEIHRDATLDESTLVGLIERAQSKGDPDAFDGLYLLFADRIFRYLLARLGRVEVAEEIVSQVFLHLIEKIDRYQIAPKDNATIFPAWLYRLAHNKMVDILRKTQRREHVGIEYAEELAEPHSLLEVIENQIDFEQLLHTLKLLNEQQRQVLLLRFVEGFSIAETAQILQKSEGAIKALQHRSLENLRRFLQQ
ncbi:MAG: sigma-70 family RNA polymerase sigma factor [Caldilineaceae bacterium]|nr:sigma-70 family RNA polymerase sigma factor [Caldilineaceae bacterium]